MYSVILKNIKELFTLEEVKGKSLYLELFTALKNGIEEGYISPNSALPPTRLLASHLSLSRSTVIKAYNLLQDAFLISSKQGSGYFVNPPVKKPIISNTTFKIYPEISEVGKAYMAGAGLAVSNKSESVAFTPGIPPVDIFPIGQWQKLTNQYWRNIRSADLNYSIASGLDTLKNHICDYLKLTRKIQCDPEQVIIVSGSLQSLYLIGNILVNKGDLVAHENPTFPNVISIFKSLRAEIVPVRSDSERLHLEELEKHKRGQIKLLHVCPSNPYPLGGKMSIPQRLAILNWANKQGSIIIENDYEHEINNWHQHTPSIFGLDTEQRTIYLGTFNRIMHPSIRLGYMVMPYHLLPPLKALQTQSHRFVPQSVQSVMTDFIHNNYVYKHIRCAIEEAKARKKHFLDLFEKHLSSHLTILENSTESFHLVAGYEGSDIELTKAFDAKGVSAHPLSKCYIENPKQGIVLGYSCINAGFMSQYIQKMKSVLR